MNKYQNALDRLESHSLNLQNELKYCGLNEDIGYLEDVKAIQELIDKETPMKPTQKGEDKFYCGKCGFAVADGNRNFLLTRCGNDACGQVVDWNENNE